MLVDEIRLRLYLSDNDILAYYFGGIHTNRKYNSPFRKDPIPSLKFYSNDGMRFYWKDYGLVSQVGNDSIAFVQTLFELPSRQDAISLIWEEIVKGCNFNVAKSIKMQANLSKNDFRIDFRELNENELPFWELGGISTQQLNKFNVKAVSAAYNNDEYIWRSEIGNPAYCYLFGEDSFKTYRPLVKDKSKKFRGKNNGDILEGWDQLPETGDVLIVTKSLKDVMVLDSMHFYAISPSSENSLKAIKAYMEEINRRFKKVFILYDNDAPGIKAATVLHKQTGWQTIFLKEAKDCYDQVKLNKTNNKLYEYIKKIIGIH